MTETDTNLILEKCTKALPAAEAANTVFDTCQVLYDLADRKEWTEQNTQQLNFLAEKVSVFKRLRSGYDSTGRMTPDSKVLGPLWVRYFAALVLNRLATNSRSNKSFVPTYICLLNAAFVAIDQASASDNENPLDAELLSLAESLWLTLKKMLPLPIDAVSTFSKDTSNALLHSDPRTIPLTVLFYEGPIARAYLETIQSLGMKPQRIVELVPSRDVVSGRSLGRWLPKSVRREYAATMHRRNMHYWANDIRQKDSELFDGIATSVCRDLDFAPETFSGAQMMRPLSEFGDCVERLTIESVRDPVLTDYLSASQESRFLFTGGGLLDREKLSLPNTRLVHVHPGYLPKIRGADCTLWSHLLYGRHSASSFYMNPGIDTGDVIEACWLPKVDLTSITKISDSMRLYRAVFAFLDPWIRAFALRQTLQTHQGGLCKIDGMPQKEKGTQTFNYLHGSLREKSLSSIFDSN